ncbi:MAG TPA: HD domain-containing phosphohydrolase [bacterium]|nr:HD domain-containing phosphohydrolase [bacterium]
MPESFRALPGHVRAFSIVLVCFYLGMAVWSFPHSHPLVVAGLAIIFAATAIVPPIPSPAGGSTFPTTSVKIVTALIWLPQDVLLGVGIGSCLGLLLFSKSEVWRAANNGAGWGIATATGALVGHLAERWGAPGLLQLSTAAVVVLCVHRITNQGIFAVYKHLRFGHPFLATWWQTVLDQWASNVLATPMAIILADAAIRLNNVVLSLGFTAVSAMALPIPRQELEYYYRFQQAVGEIVEAVVRVLEGVNPGARSHGDRVGALAAGVGRRLRMSEAGIRSMRLAARLHDVGLLVARDDQEQREQRVTAGARILSRFPDPLVVKIVRAYREQWDGTGLPYRKRGRAIPLPARILSAAETYDEILHGNGGSHSRTEAMERVRTLSGTALDPDVVEALTAVLNEQGADPAVAR